MGETLPEELYSKAAAVTTAVYRVSDVSQFDPALRFALRRMACETLAAVARCTHHPAAARRGEEREKLSAAIAGLGAVVSLGVRLGYVSPANGDRILRACRWISENIPKAERAPNSEEEIVRRVAAGAAKQLELNHRHRRILTYLSGNGRAKIGDLRGLFGEEVSERTIQRDLWQLTDAGLIRSEGDLRWRTYVSIGQ